MPSVDLVFADAGGGHRSSAEALQAALDLERRWRVRLVNLQEVLRPLDRVGRLTGFSIEDLYNVMLRRNWTWGAHYLLPLLHLAIRCFHRDQVRLLAEFWKSEPPDLVVSMVSHFNRAIYGGIHAAAPSVPFAVILTDFADVPPHFWIEPQDHFVICGSRRAVSQALEIGLPPDRVYLTSGMILHPRFHSPLMLDRPAERERLALDPFLPTAIVTFGAQGSSAMIEIVRRLDCSELELQLILMCGHNAGLASKLRTGGRLRRAVVGYTTEMPRYLALADFFIGKPGPASISEALLMGLPVIVDRGRHTMPQERYNAEWVLEQKAGLVIPSFRKIVSAVGEALSPGRLAELRANALALDNRAVFETASILDDIIERSRNSEWHPAAIGIRNFRTHPASQGRAQG